MHLPAMTPRHSTTDLPDFVSRAIDTASASTTITLHTCFCTYTQGGWGSDCHGAGRLARTAPVKLCSLVVALPAGATVSDLTDALDHANSNFDDCSTNAGFLSRP